MPATADVAAAGAGAATTICGEPTATNKHVTAVTAPAGRVRRARTRMDTRL
ncbi:hypothetical protein Q9Q99_16700 [Curtobacterium flaccumfaciens]|nr:hypothetical protein Q9Q99_16700 [Curtobacterium flaccumfaciens]